MAQVFISYIEEDSNVAHAVAKGLELAGFTTWYYRRDTRPGVDHYQETAEQIGAAGAVIAVISADTPSSRQVRSELTYAHERGKPLIPILSGITHEKLEKHPWLNLILGGAVCIGVTSLTIDDRVQVVIRGLRDLGIHPDGHPPDGSSGPGQPARRRRRELLMVAVASVIVIAVALVFVLAGRREAHTPIGMVAQGRNAQGFGEFLWLKDSSVMIRIPAGEFVMGSPGDDISSNEHPQHGVFVGEFYVDKFEVTNRQYRRFCDETGRQYPDDPGFPDKSGYLLRYPDHPVVNVSWEDARAYALWADKRLPTEAEWEKAARGTDARTYPWGRSEPDGRKCNLADKNTDFTWSERDIDDGFACVAPVGAFPAGASPFGCLDMAGNVSEWCGDWYDAGYYGGSPARDPGGPLLGTERVVRGGSWLHAAVSQRCAVRYSYVPIFRADDLGFRCVATRSLQRE